MNTPREQRGVALLTVLLLAALVSGLVVTALDDVRFGVRGASNGQAIARARWVALGAEVVARERILQHQAAPPFAIDPAAEARIALPVEGGMLWMQLRDATTCFNLNSVAEGAGEQWQRRDAGVARYLALLAALGVPRERAEALGNALVDWIDSDQVRSAAGAEDRDYAGYRTGGTLLAEPSELRAIAGYDAGTYSRIRPFVCALPDARPLAININALRPGDGALVAMLGGGVLDAAAGARVLAARPRSGWQDTADFWALPALSAVAEADRGAIALRGSLFELQADVAQGDALLEMSALLQVEGHDRTRLVARRWSEPE